MFRVIISTLLLLLSNQAFASFEGGAAASAQAGCFKGSGATVAVDTVAKALKAGDDTPCVLEGRIVAAGPEHEEYVFQDATEKIVIELDDELFQGRTVTPETRIRIYGEVDAKLLRESEVDVDSFELLQQ